MTIDIDNSWLALYQDSGTSPEGLGFAWPHDAILRSLASRGYIDAAFQTGTPSDENKVWIADNADPTAGPAVSKVYLDSAWSAMTGPNFAEYICRLGGSYDGIQANNIAMTLYATSATLTINTAWTTYAWLNLYLNSGTFTANGAVDVVRTATPSLTAGANSAGQAVIMAIRQT